MPPPTTAPSLISVPGLHRPTTQQLTTGPRTELDLEAAPVSLKVPTGWEIQKFNDGLQVTLQGPTLTDFVGISIPVQRVISPEQLASLEAHARADFASHPDLLPRLGIRDITGAKVIENLSIKTPLSSAEPATVIWSFTICIPGADGKTFNTSELRFLGLTVQQYKNDQQFLREILETMTVTPTQTNLVK